MGREEFDHPKPIEVPKGHLAVYVGSKDDDPHRVLVPIIYFNHPLFGQLLQEAEKEFGYNHSGGIKIPCPISEFERVKTSIAAGRKTLGHCVCVGSLCLSTLVSVLFGRKKRLGRVIGRGSKPHRVMSVLFGRKKRLGRVIGRGSKPHRVSGQWRCGVVLKTNNFQESFCNGV
ncbi:hypothetical protein IFM89_018721 [Coptis chinensis]|uniref:Uncharacterized protein n=1 Tax=Coptis chinensis TaxID=261450 RepID=A0A835IC67_9MAGN|nr:hypothetical protein IFM89_018721 [Coptis chinensis]